LENVKSALARGTNVPKNAKAATKATTALLTADVKDAFGATALGVIITVFIYLVLLMAGNRKKTEKGSARPRAV
jgi:hypothetical protein